MTLQKWIVKTTNGELIASQINFILQHFHGENELKIYNYL